MPKINFKDTEKDGKTRQPSEPACLAYHPKAFEAEHPISRPLEKQSESARSSMVDLYGAELQLQARWKVEEQEKVNKLETKILQQIEGMEVYNMIAPKHTDKSREIVELEKKFSKAGKGVFVIASCLDER
jgi:hypothetical protein